MVRPKSKETAKSLILERNNNFNYNRTLLVKTFEIIKSKLICFFEFTK